MNITFIGRAILSLIVLASCDATYAEIHSKLPKFDLQGLEIAVTIAGVRLNNPIPTELGKMIKNTVKPGWFSLDQKRLGAPWDSASGSIDKDNRLTSIACRAIFLNSESMTLSEPAISFRDQLLNTLTETLGSRPEIYAIAGDYVAGSDDNAEADGSYQIHAWIDEYSVLSIGLMVGDSRSSVVTLSSDSRASFLKGIALDHVGKLRGNVEPVAELLRTSKPLPKNIDLEKLKQSFVKFNDSEILLNPVDEPTQNSAGVPPNSTEGSPHTLGNRMPSQSSEVDIPDKGVSMALSVGIAAAILIGTWIYFVRSKWRQGKRRDRS
jgi:hypothetical protein